MRRIVVEETWKVVPSSIEDNLSRRDVSTHPFRAGPVVIVRFTLSNLLHSRAKVKEQKDAQDECRRRRTQRLKHLAPVVLAVRYSDTLTLAIEKGLEFLLHVGRQTR